MKIDRNVCIRLDRDINQINRSKKLLEHHGNMLHTNTKLLNLLGNKVRLSIVLLLLEEKKLCVCDLAEILEMKIPAVSQHLRKMKDGNLVYAIRQGTVLWYAIVKKNQSFIKSNLVENHLV